MFFSSVLFTKRGNLAKVWLAAHHQDKRLTKAIVVSTNIEECSHELSEPKVPLSLRISGQLLLGVVRIYQRKVRYLQEDTQEALTKVRMSSRPGAGALELHPSHATATSSHITFVDPIENDFLDFAIPDIPLNRLDEICEDGFSQQEMGRAHDMMLEQDDRFSYNMSLNQGAKQFDDVHDVLMTGEEDVIRIEPLVHADDKLDESVEVGRDAQDFDADIPLLPLDIDYAEPLKDGESESILAPDHGAMTEELIPLIDPLNDNVSILGHGHDQSVLGSVDLAQDFAGDINIAVKKSRKRKRVQHDRSIQISSAELMNQDTSQLVAKRGEFVLQPEPPMLGSTSADMPDWLLAPSEAIGPLCQELVNVLSSNLEKANLTTAAETNERPEIDENCLIEGSGPRDDAPANRAEDNLDVSQKDSPGQFYDEPPSFFDDGAPAPDHQVEDFSQKGSGFDDDDGRKFEEQFINPEPLIASEIVAEPEAAEDEASQSGAFSSWSERTKKMCVLLSERLDKDDASLSLQSLIQGKSRSTAAIIFLETLILKTHDFIDLDQQQPYGEIDIKPASRFQTGIPVADMLAITG